MKNSPAHILTTRPVGQHANFRLACEQRGLKVSHLPCLQILPLATEPFAENLLVNTDIVLFTSVNAVRHAHAIRPLPWNNIRVHAIGYATAELLRTLQQPLDFSPLPPFRSETYLQQLHAERPSKLLLIKGQGGRELIQRQLLRRGWTIESWDVYRRVMPDTNPALLEQVFARPGPDIVSITSNESLSNLVKIAADYHDHLMACPLIVNSERAAQLASSLGFKLPALVAIPAGDQGQLLQLDQWLQGFQAS